MLRDPLFILAAVGCLIVAAVLLTGIGNFGLGGDAKRSNKLMQWRIIAQFVAVMLILVFATLGRGGN